MNRFAWLLSLPLLALLAMPVVAADKKDKKLEEIEKKQKKDKKKGTTALLEPSEQQLASEATARDITAAIEQEVAARAVPVPPQMALDLEWTLPHIDATKFGILQKGWVLNDLILVETSKNFLLAITRADGVLRWVCQLEDFIRYQPSVSRNNVVVNVKNFLVAIHKDAGYVRWKILPKFMMSSAPLVIDPPVYPKGYSDKWQDLEAVYVGGWDGRFYYMTVRARNTNYSKNIRNADQLIAPEFDLYYHWHITHNERGIVAQPIVVKDTLLYYIADDKKVYCISRDREEREPYILLDIPTTNATVTSSSAANVTNSVVSSLYVGARDNSLYCLDRLTLRKKWNYAAGVTPTGNIFADEAATPYVYFAANDGQVHAVEVKPMKISRGQPEVPENFSPAWTVAAEGTLGAGPEMVYLGSGKKGDLAAYGSIKAVDKMSGTVRWEVSGGGKDSFFQQFLEFHNAWNSGWDARVYAITADNRVLSFKERLRDTGIKVVKPTEAAAPNSRLVGIPKPPADPAAPAEEKKPEAKPEEKK